MPQLWKTFHQAKIDIWNFGYLLHHLFLLRTRYLMSWGLYRRKRELSCEPTTALLNFRKCAQDFLDKCPDTPRFKLGYEPQLVFLDPRKIEVLQSILDAGKSLDKFCRKNLNFLKSNHMILRDYLLKYPDLIQLILQSPWMDQDERQYWFDLIPAMKDAQIDSLYEILSAEHKAWNKLSDDYFALFDNLYPYLKFWSWVRENWVQVQMTFTRNSELRTRKDSSLKLVDIDPVESKS